VRNACVWFSERGWWSLEILLTVALCVAVTSAGVVMMYQVMGMNNGLYPRNQIEQVELSRILMEMEGDFAQASRAYVWNSQVQEQVGGVWGALQTGTHSVADTAGDLNLWALSVKPDDEATFLSGWTGATIRSVASDATHKYYTLLLLGGGSKINAVVYLTCTEAPSEVTYALERYENNGNRLVQSASFTHAAPGASFTNSDQSATPTQFPSITQSATGYDCVDVRLPTAFSTALRDLGTGAQARRVKKTADEWGVWTFTVKNTGRWVRNY